MENKRFEIKGFKDHRKFGQFSYMFGIFIFSFLVYSKYYYGEWEPVANLFVFLILIYSLRLLYPKKCFQRIFVDFKDDKIYYHVTGFSFKARVISISEIQEIKTFESAIYIKRRDSEIKMSLIPFSIDLKDNIRAYFEELNKEITKDDAK